MSAEPTHNQISLLNILLSSSVVLGAATGIFYLVGGAQYEGYSSAVLGMNLLGGLQPSEYIFSGAELLLFTSAIGLSLLLLPVVLLAAASISGAAGFLAAPLRTRIPRKWEIVTFLSVFGIASVGIGLATLTTFVATESLLARGSCPVTGHASTRTAAYSLILAVIVGTFGFFLFQPKLFRAIALIWVMVAALFCLYTYGWQSGAQLLYNGKFTVAEIVSKTLESAIGRRLLVIGRDDKHFVILPEYSGRPDKLRPVYVLRSDIERFTIVGISTINDFVCQPRKESHPK